MINYIYNRVYISGRHAIRQMEEVKKLGIYTIVRLDHAKPKTNHPTQWTDDFDLLYRPIHDGEPIPVSVLRSVPEFIYEHTQQRQKVLIHCQMGVSRSVTLTLAYLIQYEGMTLPQAYQTIHTARPHIYPHPKLLWSLVEHYKLPYTQMVVFDHTFHKKLLEDTS